jgi:hypothetical protein
LRAESRETEIIVRTERIDLHVSFHEFDIGDSRRLGIRTAIFEKSRTAIDGENMALGPHSPGELDGCVAESAADVDNPVAGLQLEAREYLGAVERQAADDDVPPSGEFRNEDGIPEFHRWA